MSKPTLVNPRIVELYNNVEKDVFAKYTKLY